MKPRYHYKAEGTPVASTVACGRRIWNLGMHSFATSDVAAVTCKACTNTIAKEPWIVTAPTYRAIQGVPNA